MATIAEDLRTFLIADDSVKAKVGSRIHENHVPFEQGKLVPYIFYQVTGTEDDGCVDAAHGSTPVKWRFAVECIDRSIGAARTLANLVHARLNLYRGSAFGSSTVQGVFASNVPDDYVPLGVGDSGLHVAAFDVEVML